ncbi:Transporter [Methylorubrum aminovorans]
MMKNWLAAGAIALTAGMTTTVAQAQSTMIPGENVGLATGAPLPEGIYAINTFIYRSQDTAAADTAINIPILVWATPFVPFGGRIEFVVAPPTVFTFSRVAGGRDTSINVGTFVGGLWAFDLGGNVGVSFLFGSYLNELNAGRGGGLNILASNTYRAGAAISYTGDGYNLTANLTYQFYDTPGRFDGPNGIPAFFGPVGISDALNIDLTATKKFGKFEIGAVGYGTVNLDPNILVFPAGLGVAPGRLGRGGRFALGGLIGYDFGPFSVQAYVARDVVTTGPRGVESTDGFFRIVAPLYTPAAAPAPMPAPLVRKY